MKWNRNKLTHLGSAASFLNTPLSALFTPTLPAPQKKGDGGIMELAKLLKTLAYKAFKPGFNSQAST